MGLFGLFGGKKSNPEDSIPQTDAEKWTVAAYAMWSEYCGGSYKYFGGFEKNRSNASMVRGVLSRDWCITNKQGVYDMVAYLIDDANNTGENEQSAAFGYGCAANILARGYVGGHLTKEELITESAKVAKVMRAHFNSWEEFAKQYIVGVGLESNVKDKQPEFEEIYNRLAALPDGPYSVEWDTQF